MGGYDYSLGSGRSYNAGARNALGNSPYGLYDHQYSHSRGRGRFEGTDEVDDRQLRQYNQYMERVQQAYSRGLLTHDEYDEAQRAVGNDHRNWIQRALFDAPTHALGMLGAEVYDEKTGNLKTTGRRATGSVLDTFGDVLSLPLYATSSMSAAGLDAIQELNRLRAGAHKDKDSFGVNIEAGGAAFHAGPFEGAVAWGTHPLASIATKKSPLAGHMGIQMTGPPIFWDPKSNPNALMSAGFSPSAFAKAWHNRTDFIEFSDSHGVWGDSMWGNLAGGLVMDIGLDPLTYATFGVAAGAKLKNTAKLRRAASAGSKLSQAEPAALTLNGRVGQRMFRTAAHDYLKTMREGITADRGLDGKHLLDAVHSPKLMSEITAHMVENFPRLAGEMFRTQRQGRFRTLKHMFPASEANRSFLMQAGLEAEGGLGRVMGMSVDDLFVETASAMHKERALYSTTRAQKFLAGGANPSAAPGLRHFNDAARWVFDRFDLGWDAPPELVERMRATGVALRNEMDDSLVRYAPVFSEMAGKKRETVSRAVEEMFQFEQFGQSGLGAAVTYDDEIMTAARFVKEEMEGILAAERSADYATQSVSGYISHIYKNPEHRDLAMRAIMRNGEVQLAAGNRFTQQRMIASIAQGEDVFGEGSMLLDAFHVLRARKKASLEMIHKGRMQKWILENNGVADLMIRGARDGMSNGLIRGMFRRSGYGTQDIIEVGQVYKTVNGNLARLGFKDGDLARNRDLLTYLMRENTDGIGANKIPGKFSDEGVAHGEKLGVGEAARLHAVETASTELLEGSKVATEIISTKPIPRSFSYKLGSKTVREAGEHTQDFRRGLTGGDVAGGHAVGRTGEKLTFDVSETMKMMQDPSHPTWSAIFRPGREGTFDQGGLIQWVKAFDGYTKKYLDSQLAGFIPDFEARVLKAMKHHGVPFDKFDGTEKALQRTVAELSAPLEVRKVVPQLGETWEVLGRRTREATGYLGDTMKPMAWTKTQMRAQAAKLGFEDRTLKELIEAMFNKKSLDELSQRDADTLLDLFYTHSDGAAIAKATGAKGAKFDAAPSIALNRADDPVVKVTLAFNRKMTGNPIPEVFDQQLALRMGEATVDTKSTAGQAIAATGDAPTVRAYDDLVNETTRIRRDTTKMREVFEKQTQRSSMLGKEIKQAKAAYPARYKDALHVRRTKGILSKFVRLERAARAGAPTGEAVAALATAKKELQEMAPGIQRLLFGDDAVDRAIDMRELLIEAKRRTAALNEQWRPLKGVYEKYRKVNDHINSLVAKRQRLIRKMTKQSQKIKAAEVSKEGIRGQHGVFAGADDVVQQGTPSDMLRRARDMRKAAGSDPEKLANAQAVHEAALKQMQEYVVAGSPAEKALANMDEFAGGLRPDNSKVHLDIHVPRSVRTVLENFLQPDLPHSWQVVNPTAFAVLRKYDKMQSFFKTNLLLPWGGTWLRNFVSNASIVYMRNGLDFLSPAGGFQNARDFSATMGYMLGTATDLPGILAPAKQGQLSGWLKKTGDRVIKSDMGREITVREMAEYLHNYGVTKGMATAEGLDMLASGETVGGKLLAGSSGGAAGMTLGAVAGGAVGADKEDASLAGIATGAALGAAGGAGVGKLIGRSPGKGALAGGLAGAGAGNILSGGADYETASWGSLMGLAAGSALGVRNMSRMSRTAKAKHMGGIPVPAIDKVTGLLQSQWAPFMRIGEASTEAPFRVALFMQEFKRSGSMREASQQVFRHLNDWHAMSTFERRFMRRMVPFYTWSKLAMRQTFVTMGEEPGRLGNILKVFRDINSAQHVDPEDIPDFYHDRLVVLANSGKEIWSGFGLPIEDVAEMISGIPDPEMLFDASKGYEDELIEARKRAFGRGPFGVTAVLEGAFNEDAFTGREIHSDAEVTYFEQGKRWEGAPSWLKKFVGYKEAAAPGLESTVNAHIAWTLGKTHVSRFVDTVKKLFEMDEEGRKRMNVYTLARVVLGPNVYRKDPETEKYYKNKGRIDALANILASIGASGKSDRHYLIDLDEDDETGGTVGSHRFR